MRPGTAPARRHALLEELRKRPEITSAAPLRPGAKSDVVQRMFYAKIDDDADVGGVLRELNRLPEIESASLPAERHILGG